MQLWCNFSLGNDPITLSALQTYNLTNKSELLVTVEAPEGPDGTKEVKMVTDQVQE